MAHIIELGIHIPAFEQSAAVLRTIGKEFLLQHSSPVAGIITASIDNASDGCFAVTAEYTQQIISECFAGRSKLFEFLLCLYM